MIKIAGQNSLRRHISGTAFLKGLAAVFLGYILIFTAVFIKADETVETLAKGLASQTVKIQSVAPPPPEVIQPGKDLSPQDFEQPPTHIIPDQIINPSAASGALPPAPIPDLVEYAETGPLPKIAANGLTPFQAYKKPFAATAEPLIAIVVRNFGLSETDSQKVLSSLPAEISLILTPYAQDPQTWQQSARQNGHEVWMELPAQNKDYMTNDPGPQALLSHASLQYNQDRLEWVLSRTSGYAGVAVYIDEVLPAAKSMSQSIFTSLFERGLGYFELNSTAPPVIETMAIAAKAPYVRNSFLLAGPDNKTAFFRQVENTAKKRGHAVVLIDPYPHIVEEINAWIRDLKTRGFSLAPVSAVAHMNQE